MTRFCVSCGEFVEASHGIVTFTANDADPGVRTCERQELLQGEDSASSTRTRHLTRLRRSTNRYDPYKINAAPQLKRKAQTPRPIPITQTSPTQSQLQVILDYHGVRDGVEVQYDCYGILHQGFILNGRIAYNNEVYDFPSDFVAAVRKAQNLTGTPGGWSFVDILLPGYTHPSVLSILRALYERRVRMTEASTEVLMSLAQENLRRDACNRMSISLVDGTLPPSSSTSEQSAWQVPLPLTPCSDILVHRHDISPPPSVSLGADSNGDGLLADEILLLDSVALFDPADELLLSPQYWPLG